MHKLTPKLFHLIFSLAIIFCFTSCVTTSADFEKTTRGHFLEAPINTDVLKQSILKSLMTYNWEVTYAEDGQINARYSKSENTIVADIEIIYNEETYEISYIDSKNLDVDLEKMSIHRNYNRWIANLNKTIYMEYIENLWKL